MVAPGWYPDPQNAQLVRFWDGAQWTDQLRPAFGPAPVSPYAAPAASGPQTLWQQNKLSGITMIVSVIYVLLAVEARIALLGIFPVLMTVRAFNRKERLAPLAAVFAAIAIIISLVHLAH